MLSTSFCMQGAAEDEKSNFDIALMLRRGLPLPRYVQARECFEVIRIPTRGKHRYSIPFFFEDIQDNTPVALFVGILSGSDRELINRCISIVQSIRVKAPYPCFENSEVRKEFLRFIHVNAFGTDQHMRLKAQDMRLCLVECTCLPPDIIMPEELLYVLQKFKLHFSNYQDKSIDACTTKIRELAADHAADSEIHVAHALIPNRRRYAEYRQVIDNYLLKQRIKREDEIGYH